VLLAAGLLACGAVGAAAAAAPDTLDLPTGPPSSRFT
jgi:hypothetical protein